MATIFYVRHQAAGRVSRFPFSEHPSKEQIDAVTAICVTEHGEFHPKVRELPADDERRVPYWVRVEEEELLGPSDIPSVPEVSLSVSNVAAVGDVSVSGVGTVTNP